MLKAQFKRDFISNENGMTLIEIMVVILIIGGLMAVLGSNVMTQYNKSKFRNSEIQMRVLLGAVHAYEMDCGQPPSADLGLTALSVDPGRDECSNCGPQPYAQTKNLKDSYGHGFQYDVIDGNPVLTFLGKDGRPGGTDLNRDVSTEEPSSSDSTEVAASQTQRRE